jgi:hypothetical protein
MKVSILYKQQFQKIQPCPSFTNYEYSQFRNDIKDVGKTVYSLFYMA